MAIEIKRSGRMQDRLAASCKFSTSADGVNLSNQYVVKHVSGDIGQSVSATVVEVCQLLVVNAKQMQHRRVQVMHGDAICDGAEADFIEFTVAGSLANSRTRHEHPKPVRIMITTNANNNTCAEAVGNSKSNENPRRIIEKD